MYRREGWAVGLCGGDMQRGDRDTSRVETVLRSVARVVGDALATFHCRRGILFRGSFQDTPECGFEADDRSKASVASVSPSVSCTEAKRERPVPEWRPAAWH